MQSYSVRTYLPRLRRVGEACWSVLGWTDTRAVPRPTVLIPWVVAVRPADWLLMCSNEEHLCPITLAMHRAQSLYLSAASIVSSSFMTCHHRPATVTSMLSVRHVMSLYPADQWRWGPARRLWTLPIYDQFGNFGQAMLPGYVVFLTFLNIGVTENLRGHLARC